MTGELVNVRHPGRKFKTRPVCGAVFKVKSTQRRTAPAAPRRRRRRVGRRAAPAAGKAPRLRVNAGSPWGSGPQPWARPRPVPCSATATPCAVLATPSCGRLPGTPGAHWLGAETASARCWRPPCSSCSAVTSQVRRPPGRDGKPRRRQVVLRREALGAFQLESVYAGTENTNTLK